MENIFFLSATPTAEKKKLNGLAFSKRTPYVSRVTEFIALRLAPVRLRAAAAACVMRLRGPRRGPQPPHPRPAPRALPARTLRVTRHGKWVSPI